MWELGNDFSFSLIVMTSVPVQVWNILNENNNNIKWRKKERENGKESSTRLYLSKWETI